MMIIMYSPMLISLTASTHVQEPKEMEKQPIEGYETDRISPTDPISWATPTARYSRHPRKALFQ